MCDDHAAAHPGPSRRIFLGGAASLAAAGVVGARPSAALARRLPLRSAARPVTANGTSAYSMAMHVHSSFDEEEGSMDAQLWQAWQAAVDVLWWTSHDKRLGGADDGSGFRKEVHFLGFTDPAPPGQGKPWTWVKVLDKPYDANCYASFVTSPVTPNDPGGGSLLVSAQPTSAERQSGLPGMYGVEADTHKAGWNERMNLSGQSLSIDVLPLPGWSASDGYQEFLLGTSYHQAYGG